MHTSILAVALSIGLSTASFAQSAFTASERVEGMADLKKAGKGLAGTLKDPASAIFRHVQLIRTPNGGVLISLT